MVMVLERSLWGAIGVRTGERRLEEGCSNSPGKTEAVLNSGSGSVGERRGGQTESREEFCLQNSCMKMVYNERTWHKVDAYCVHGSGVFRWIVLHMHIDQLCNFYDKLNTWKF